MRLFKKKDQATLQHLDQCYSWKCDDWDDLINREGLHDYLLEKIKKLPRVDSSILNQSNFDPPINRQEVWAAGVTYLKSKEARMGESRKSGGDVFYDKVYDAPRPELFFKATLQRTVGTGDNVNIRKDSTWNVPEPELTLFINSNGNIQGYTVGNDMSSRSIEGENPLYLPQAKVFERCAALGPCLYIPQNPIDEEAEILMEIRRNENLMYKDRVRISRMKRTHTELVDYLFEECEFSHGVFLMTGTCLVPNDEFTLNVNDQIIISIDHIGTLVNNVSQLER